MYFKVAKSIDLKSFDHEKKFCNIECSWMLTRLVGGDNLAVFLCTYICIYIKLLCCVPETMIHVSSI